MVFPLPNFFENINIYERKERMLHHEAMFWLLLMYFGE